MRVHTNDYHVYMYTYLYIYPHYTILNYNAEKEKKIFHSTKSTRTMEQMFYPHSIVKYFSYIM